MPWLTEADALERLVQRIHQEGSAAAFAAQVGCSPALVSQALHGKKAIGKKLAEPLGLIAVPVVTYRYLVKDGE